MSVAGNVLSRSDPFDETSEFIACARNALLLCLNLHPCSDLLVVLHLVNRFHESVLTSTNSTDAFNVHGHWSGISACDYLAFEWLIDRQSLCCHLSLERELILPEIFYVEYSSLMYRSKKFIVIPQFLDDVVLAENYEEFL